MTALTGSLIGVAVAVAVVVLAWFYVRTASRKTRLRMLRTRVSVARGALGAALDRRVAVARSLAAELGDDDLRAAADAAATAEPGERELCENRLSSALTGVAIAHEGTAGTPVAELRAQLQDAQIRIMIARRFYNDAVRDTRTLQQRRLVRWLHLAKGQQRAEFFEIADSL